MNAHLQRWWLPVVTILALLLVSCAPGGPPAPAAPAEEGKPAEVPKEKVKVVWWEQTTDEDYFAMLQREFVDSFNAAHDDIELEFISTPNLNDVLRTAIQAGAGPDIIYTPGPAFTLEYVNAGHLLPLDEYAEQYGWKEKMLPWAYDAGVIGGKLYSVQLTYETMVLYYNKTLFDQHGWKPPTNRAELEALGAEMEKEGLSLFSNANALWKGVNEWLVGVFYNRYAGADNVYKALTGEMRWDDPLFVESIELLKNYMDRGWFSNDLDSYFTLTWEDLWNAFCSGEVPMKIEGTWALQGAPQYCDADWDWAPLPVLREGVDPVYDLAIGASLSINAESEHPDEAAEVLNWLYNDKERAARIIEGFNFGEWVVPLHFTREDFSGDVDERFLRYIEDFAKVTGEGKYGYTTWTFWPAKTDVYIIEELDGVLTGDITPLEYSQELQKVFEEEVATGKTLPVLGPPDVDSSQ